MHVEDIIQKDGRGVRRMTDEECFHYVLSQQGCDEAIVKSVAEAAENRITKVGCQHGCRRSPPVATCARQVLLAKGYDVMVVEFGKGNIATSQKFLQRAIQ